MILENKRLAVCAELIAADGFAGIDGKKRAADVGTDHGYLAAYLAAEGICESVLACDINEKPLALARRTIAENGLSDRVTAVLTDGLDGVDGEGITHIICAGMGGELIADIISRCKWAKNTHLVLQPMTKSDELRRYLYENGWRVVTEKAQHDGDFVYSVMLAELAAGKIGYPCDERYLTAGRLIPGEADANEYLLMRAGRLRKAGAGMSGSASEEVRAEGRRLTALAERLENEAEGKA